MIGRKDSNSSFFQRWKTSGVVTAVLAASPFSADHVAFAGRDNQCPAIPGNFLETKSVIWRTEDLLPLVSKMPAADNLPGAWTLRHTTSIVSRLTKNQSGDNRALVGFFDRQGIVTATDQRLRIAALKEVKSTEFKEAPGLGRYLLQQLGKAFGEHAREHSELIRALGQGLSFNLDSRGVSKASSNQGKDPASLKYGLVLKDVRASGRGVHVASLTMDDSLMEQAINAKSQAKVDWTIGPLTESDGNPLADYRAPAPWEGPKAQGLFSLRPDFSLRGKIEPNLSRDGSSKIGMRMRLEQPQGLYRMEMISASGVAKGNVNHEFRLPVYRHLTLVRNLDQKMGVTKTSVLNVLGFSERLSLIPVNMHLVHKEKLLKAETGFDWMRGRVALETNVTGFSNVKQLTGRDTPVPPSYSVNYGRNF